MKERPVSPEGPAPLPCPFCGNAGRVQPRSHSDRWHTGNGDWLVVCPGNGCAARVGATREEAIAAWNRRPARSAGSPETPDCDEDTHYWTTPATHGAVCKCGEKAWRGAITPEAWEMAARKAFAMYDWNKTETRCINDFILTCCDAAAELLNGQRPSPGEAGAPTDDTFSQSFDAAKWAAAFVQRAKKDDGFATDEGNMIGWFANALMRGYDEARSKYEVPAALSGDREDSERLNFLENSRRGMEYLTCDDQDGEPTRHFWMVDDVLPDKYRVTLREAIDAARSTPAAQET